jgi:peptidoglycan/LPS O-acetylase OafA/YrhL
MTNAAKEKRKFFPSLSALRVIATTGIVLLHAIPVFLVNYPLLSSILKAGVLGVPFFFILSGFVLTWNYNPKISAKEFIILRIVRIYPIHFLCLSISLFAFYIFGTPLAGFVDNGTIWEKAANYSLIHSLLPLYWTDKYSHLALTWNGVSWFISCLCVFYIISYFLFEKIDKLNAANIIYIMIIMYSCFLIIAMIAYRKQYNTLLYFLYISPFSRISDFFIGCCGGRVLKLILKIENIYKQKIIMNIAMMLGISLFMLSCMCLILFHRDNFQLTILLHYLSIPGLLLLIISFAYRDFYGDGLKILKYISRLEKFSYAIFMSHALVLGVFAHFFKDIFFIIPYTITSFAIGYLLYIFYDVPIQNSLKAFILSKLF